MKQLGNLALVCARRPEVLMTLHEGKVSVYVGAGPERAVMGSAWDDDAEINRIIHELNFGCCALKNANPPLEGSAKLVQERMWSGLMENPHLYSTVHTSLIDMETDETIEALYDHAGQYQEIIAPRMEAFCTQKYPSNDLMRYFRLLDNPLMERTIREKFSLPMLPLRRQGHISMPDWICAWLRTLPAASWMYLPAKLNLSTGMDGARNLSCISFQPERMGLSCGCGVTTSPFLPPLRKTALSGASSRNELWRWLKKQQ